MSLVFQPTPGRIVIRGVNWLGDAVMTTPALLRLRETFPAAQLTLLTPEKLAGLWKHHAAVDEVISFALGEDVFAVGKKLRAVKADLALVLPNSPRSALEVWLAHIPRRIGYARPWRNFLLTRSVAPCAAAIKMHKRTLAEIKNLVAPSLATQSNTPQIPTAAHQIYEYLHLTAALGADPTPLPPQLTVAPDELADAKTKFGLDRFSSPLLGLNPGAEYGPAKRWPVEKFITVAREIQQRTHGAWILFGGANDVPLANQIESAFVDRPGAVINLAGKTELRELMSLLKLCHLLLTNDTGPMHVAAALGTPVVVVFGSTSPALTGPGLPGDTRHQFLSAGVACSPCFLRECPIDFRCMNNLGVENVTEAIMQVLKQSQR